MGPSRDDSKHGDRSPRQHRLLPGRVQARDDLPLLPGARAISRALGGGVPWTRAGDEAVSPFAGADRLAVSATDQARRAARGPSGTRPVAATRGVSTPRLNFRFSTPTNTGPPGHGLAAVSW